MVQWIKKHWLECTMSLFLTIVSAVVITSQFTYLCDTNDDVLLRSIVSGTFTGMPDAHLIYIMYPLGLILKALYQLSPNVLWYDGFMIGLHYICWFLLATRVGSLYESKWKKIVATLLSYTIIILIDLPYMVMHQYTVLAAVVGSVALLWILADRSDTVGEFVRNHIVTVLALTLCLWIRNQVFLMLMPFVGIAVIWRICKVSKEHIKKSIARYFVALGVVVAILLTSFIVEKAAYSSEEWKEFLAYNEARTDVYDFYQAPPYELYKDAYASMGFNEYDALVIGTHNIGLMPEVDTQTLETLAGWSKEFRDWQEQYYSVYRKTMFSLMDSILYNQVQPIGTVLIMMYALGIFISVIKDRKKDVLAILAVGLFQCLFVAYFLYQNRFPERVSYGFYLMQFVFLAGIQLQNMTVGKVVEEKRKKYFWNVVFALLIAVVGVNAGMYCYKNALDHNRERVALATEWECIKQYCNQHNEQQFFMKTNAVGAYCEMMFMDETLATANTHYLGTWLLDSPLYETRLGNAGIKDCGSYLAQNENGCMLQLGDETTDWLTEFYRAQGYRGAIEITDSIYLPDGSTLSVLQMVEE